MMETFDKRNREDYQILTREPLAISGKTTLGRNFPLSQGWFSVMFRINLTVTIGTGAGPITEGELAIIKSINLRTDKNEVLISNVPGRGIFKQAIPKFGTTPSKTAIAAASGTYTIDLPVIFSDPGTMRPYDSILDTSRYQTMTLEVILGGVADLFTAPGTASVTATLDMVVHRTKEVLPIEARPIWYRQLIDMPPISPTSATFIDIERSSDLGIARLFIWTSSTATAGVEWSGTASNVIMAEVNLRDSANFIIQDRSADLIQSDNKTTYSLETIVAGMFLIDFVSMTGSNLDTIFTGDLARLQFSWANRAGVVATDQVTLMVEGLRKLAA